MPARALRWLCSFLVASALAFAAEGKREAPKDKPLPPKPTEDEIDKPDKAGVRPPIELPQPPAKDAKEAEGDVPKAKERNPFAERGSKPKYALPARVTYSDGKTADGYVWRNGDKPVRIFNRAERAHQDYKLADLKRIDTKPDKEVFEQDWRWKEQGSSEMVKLETGYFWNEYCTTFTLAEGKPAAGDCNADLKLQTLDGKRDLLILWKRQSGREFPHAKREELKPLVYIKSIEFTDDFLKKAEEKKE